MAHELCQHGDARLQAVARQPVRHAGLGRHLDPQAAAPTLPRSAGRAQQPPGAGEQQQQQHAACRHTRGEGAVCRNGQ